MTGLREMHAISQN